MPNPDFSQLFAEAKTFAIVGYSDNPQRAGHFVPAYLRQRGYTVIAVNPKFGESVDGLPNYPSLAAIPADVQVDVIDIFRNPAHLPGVLADAQAMARPAKYFWMQPGAENPEVAEQAAAAGYLPVMNACALAELRNL